MYHILTPSNFHTINLHGSILWYAFASRVENSVYPDQLASQKPDDQDTFCFPLQDINIVWYQGLAWWRSIWGGVAALCL